MNHSELHIEEAADDGLAVTPPDPAAIQDDAGEDATIAADLDDTPHDDDSRLDRGLDESMDASDTPSALQPGDDDAVPSSGFDEAEEAGRQRDA